jgi:hypothetical protein
MKKALLVIDMQEARDCSNMMKQRMKRYYVFITTASILFLLAISSQCRAYAGEAGSKSSDVLMYQYSTTIETEKPELDEMTRELIAEYRRNPTQENYDHLRNQVGINYDKVLEKKRAKLQELQETAKEQSKIDEMQVIVDEMIRDREIRIDQTMSRFTDPRLSPGYSDVQNGYVPVMGAGENIYISATPITNAEYAAFLEATGHDSPPSWADSVLHENAEAYPVVSVSYKDTVAYCAWLNTMDRDAAYRLPTEEEWELAAGHMPKDAAMNSGGVRQTITSVYEFEETTAASGAIDMWGNVWEWTSTLRDSKDGIDLMAVKGGAWDSPKTDCRTEYRAESRQGDTGYLNVGFRVIREIM